MKRKSFEKQLYEAPLPFYKSERINTRRGRIISFTTPARAVVLYSNEPHFACLSLCIGCLCTSLNRNEGMKTTFPCHNPPCTEEVAGEGAGLAFEACHQAFDGRRACGVNDTLFDNSRVAKKGGAVAIGSGDGRSHVEFHRCRLNGSSTGKAIKDDPQGEGGAFSVGGGVTLILSDCVINNSYCGKKVSLFRSSFLRLTFFVQP